ncbi:hypothetical protein MRY87_11135 [bacterium]|nr:hypothetical protein [bacterium]
MRKDTEKFRVNATCTVHDPSWAKTPSGTRVEAELAVHVLDATWPSIESEIRIQILSETWPQLTQHASIHIDDEETPCPEELFDSMLTYAKDQYSERVWQTIGGAFTAKLSGVKPGTFTVGKSFQIKKDFPKRHEFSLEVGPLLVPKTPGSAGGMIPKTAVTVSGSHESDLSLEIPISPS